MRRFIFAIVIVVIVPAAASPTSPPSPSPPLYLPKPRDDRRSQQEVVGRGVGSQQVCRRFHAIFAILTVPLPCLPLHAASHARTPVLCKKLQASLFIAPCRYIIHLPSSLPLISYIIISCPHPPHHRAEQLIGKSVSDRLHAPRTNTIATQF